MSIQQLLNNINKEDHTVPRQIKKYWCNRKVGESDYYTDEKGGRLFYIGAGTSGRLGIVDDIGMSANLWY